MQSAVMQALVFGWLLASLVGPLHGSPQRPYWALPQVADRPDIGRIQFQGPSNYPYESIDRFQSEQRRQYGPQSWSWNNRDNRFQNEQESHYQSLSRATENPLRNIRNQDVAKEPQTYYPDYIYVGDNQRQSYSESNPSASDALDKSGQNPDEEKIAVLMNRLLADESYSATLNELEALNSLDDEMIAEATISEDVKRGVRQVRPQRPGILWTLARLAFEKINDTKSAVNQIGTIVNNSFPPDAPSTTRPIIVTTTTTTSSVSDGESTSSETSANTVEDGATTTTTTTTTEAPKLTRKEIAGIIRRNLKGLIRLFNIEWRDALTQSQVSVREFQRDLGNQVQTYLEDKPITN